MLAERLELNSPHGQRIIGILLFQDLAVIPLLILLPALAAGIEDLAASVAYALLKAAVVLALLLVLGQRLMRGWFHLVARQKSPELFVLNVLLITLGLAYITWIAGLSLALGAFVAGALISETEYRHQVEVDIQPFRDILLGLFFVTIGMMLDLQVVLEQRLWVASLVVLLLAVKAVLIFGLARLFGASTAVALRSGLALAAAGEFGFVLLARADGLGVVSPARQSRSSACAVDHTMPIVRITCAAPRPNTMRRIATSFGRLNSRPIVNMRNTTPISPRWRASSDSEIQPSACGPIAMPTMR